MNIRRVILTLHLWGGMAAAVFLFLLGITGSLMAFEDEIDRALNPKLTWIEPGTARLSLTELKTKLEAANPGYTLTAFGFPPRNDMAWNASLSSTTSDNGIDLAINPFTGSVLGSQADRNDWMNYVHQFHLRLMLGRTGATIMTWAAVFLLLLSLSGLVLWWPRKVFTVNWRRPLKVLNFDVHQTLGIYCSVFLMIFSLTAMVIRFDDEATGYASRLTGSEKTPPFPRLKAPPQGAAALGPDVLLAIAEKAEPGASPALILLGYAPVRVAMKFPEDHTPVGRTNLFIDPLTGKIVYQLSSRTGPLGFRIVKLWNREIHTGDIGGLPTRIIACLVSLALPVMTVTGPLIWWNRRRALPSTLPPERGVPQAVK
jgi:uncharacterized iron-regulated membrane protein